MDKETVETLSRLYRELDTLIDFRMDISHVGPSGILLKFAPTKFLAITNDYISETGVSSRRVNRDGLITQIQIPLIDALDERIAATAKQIHDLGGKTDINTDPPRKWIVMIHGPEVQTFGPFSTRDYAEAYAHEHTPEHYHSSIRELMAPLVESNDAD